MGRPTNERHDWPSARTGLPTGRAGGKSSRGSPRRWPRGQGLLIHCSVASYRDKRRCLQGSMMRPTTVSAASVSIKPALAAGPWRRASSMAGSPSGRHHAANDRDCAAGVPPPEEGSRGIAVCSANSTESRPVPALGDMLPRRLPVLSVRIIRPGGRSPSGPPPFPRDSTFSRPSTEAALAFVQTRARTRWGVIGEPYPSGSAREQDKSRRSTWFLRAGSEGDGRFATGDRLGQTSGGPQRYRRDGPRREPDERGTRPRTRAPHGEARSEETAGRTIARRASGRDRSTR